MTLFQLINSYLANGNKSAYGDTEISGNRIDISIHGNKTGEVAIDVNDRITKAHTGKCFYDENEDREAVGFLNFFLELDEKVGTEE